jgi:hypothetical protein
MGFSKEDIEKANHVDNKLKKRDMVMTGRSCNDILMLIIFFLTFGLMIAITAYSIKTGDPRKILTPFDSDGNQCGQPN